MKSINLKLYFLGVLIFIIGTLGIIFINRESPYIIIGVLLFFSGFNFSSILFYKSLQVEKEVLKYLFSFINISLFLFLSVFLLEKVI